MREIWDALASPRSLNEWGGCPVRNWSENGPLSLTQKNRSEWESTKTHYYSPNTTKIVTIYCSYRVVDYHCIWSIQCSVISTYHNEIYHRLKKVRPSAVGILISDIEMVLFYGICDIFRTEFFNLLHDWCSTKKHTGCCRIPFKYDMIR